MTAYAVSTPLEDFVERKLARCIGGRWPSEGRRLLRAVARKNKQVVMANQLRVSAAYVGMLLAGKRQPSPRLQARIWLAYGIHGEAWGLAPTQLSVGLESSTAADNACTLTEDAAHDAA